MGNHNNKKKSRFNKKIRFNKEIRKNNKKESSLKRKRSRYQNSKNFKLEDMKKLESNDEAFHLSLMKIEEMINIIRSWKTPTFEIYKWWDKYAQSFYLKLCTCFGVDYQHLENGFEKVKKHSTLEKEQEEHLNSSGVNQPSTEEKLSDEELKKRIEEHENTDLVCYRDILKGPFSFGSYSSGTRIIPYHLYLLVKDVVDIMEQNNNTKDLPIIEKKISDRDNASSLIANYDNTVMARDLMAGYTPIGSERLETKDYEEESRLSLEEMVEVMSVIHSRKTPVLRNFNAPLMSFYCKLCSCFRIKEYHRVEKAYEDDVCLMNMGRQPRLNLFYEDYE